MNNYEVAINSVRIVSKTLNIPEPHISFFNPSEITNKETTGMYLFESDEIVFNEEWVINSPWIEVVVTAFHETRHAYQGYCIRNKIYEAHETLDIWHHEFNNYLKPSGMNNETDDVEYLNQFIEIDAIAYTHKTMLELFNVKSIIPKIIDKEVRLRMIKI
jgi:hypothetical protein